MLTRLRFRLSLLSSGSRIHRTAIIINHQSISLGRNCFIDAFSVVKGGEIERSGLVIGDNVAIKKGAYISARNALFRIGDNSFIGVNAWLGGKGNIEIGQNSMISINCVLVSSNHDYLNIAVPYYYGPEVAEDIKIGTNVWIGSQSVVLPGVEIGDGSVVGAGSIVTRDIPPNTMVFGSPAAAVRAIDRHGHIRS